MILRSLIFVTFCLLFNVQQVFSQHRCATTHLPANNKSLDSFETWLKKRRDHHLLSKSIENGPYVIPVVVHVVHNGEPIGTGGNISDDKVIEQIDILNQDFRRQNADTVNTPSFFSNIAADTEISFVLARQDPEGLPTTGITRSVGRLNEFRITDDRILKENIYWPPEDYLNIYVASINRFLGYAQFPVANLQGLENEFDPERITDGVVMDYEYWGINPNTPGSFESFGRTTTHEVGHFLGLRHIWGDGGCNADDFCSDTPQASDNSAGCPTNKTSCGTRDMFENYMDFTNDICMNIFTTCQAERMKTVLTNSPRRKSLLNSQALVEPPTFTNDLGIRELIIDNSLSTCLDEIRPTVQVRNYGIQNINAFEISLSQNGIIVQNISSNITLFPLSITSITFDAITTTVGSDNEFEIEIIFNDERASNNSKTFSVFRPIDTPVPHQEDFSSFPSTAWETNQGSMWQIGNAAFETSTNNGFVLPYYNAPQETFGNLDFLISPVFNLSNPDFTSLSFRYAYAQNTDDFTDGLIVAVSTDCGQTFPSENYVFERYGSALETSSTLSQEFNPISQNDWITTNIDLSTFTGREVRIAFIGQNGNGNNIYIDDFQIGPSSVLSLDAATGGADNFSIASCETVQNPEIEIINRGTETISNIDLSISIDGTFSRTVELENLFIRPGRSSFETIPVSFDEDIDQFSIEIVGINNSTDQDVLNNVFSSNVLVNNEESLIPIREDFEIQRIFNEVSTVGIPDWTEFEINGNNVLYSANFNQTILGKENWLVSPTFDISELEEGSLTFDVSYAQRNTIVDGLRVLLSTNCGLEWSEVIYNKRGALLASTSELINTEWFPSNESDWRTETIDLSSFISDFFVDQIRIAFVTTNGNGNNIFLDNIQLFQTQEPNLLNNEQKMTVFPNPATEEINIALALDNNEDLELTIIDVSGRIVRRESLVNTLNQRYIVETIGLQGLYFIRLKGEETDLTQRILIGR